MWQREHLFSPGTHQFIGWLHNHKSCPGVSYSMENTTISLNQDTLWDLETIMLETEIFDLDGVIKFLIMEWKV